MDTSNNQAQTEQHTHVDFSHRLAPTNEVTDSIGLMTDRALGVLTLLLCQFTKGGNARLSDELIAGALDAAIQEVEDIKSLATAYEQKSR